MRTRSSKSAAHASTTCRTSTSTSRATPSSPSPACRARASRRSPSGRSTPRPSGDTWNRCRPTPAACSTRSAVPEVDEYRRPAAGGGACSSSEVRRALRSSVGSVTTLSNLDPDALLPRRQIIRLGQPLLYAEDVLDRTPCEGACSRVPRPRARDLRGDRGHDGPGRLPDHPRSGPSPRGRRPGRGRISARSSMTLGYDVDRPWRELSRRRTATGSSSPTRLRPCRSTPASPPRRCGRPGVARRSRATRARYTGRPPLRPPDLREDPEPDDEAAGHAYMLGRDCPTCGGQAAPAESLSVKFAGLDIAELSAMLPMKRLRRDR